MDYLGQRSELVDRTSGLVLIDPTLPNRLDVAGIRPLLDDDTLLIASKGEICSPGEVASVLLGTPKVSFGGIHGELPGKGLGEVVRFFGERAGGGAIPH